MESTILIVDDEKNTREGLRMSLEDEFDVYIADGISSALEVLKNDKIDVVVTDLRLGGDDGMELIDKVLTLHPKPICIMMTAYGSVETAVEAMKRGAYHFVTKPLNIDELEIVIKRALKNRAIEVENTVLKKQVSREHSLTNMVGKSPVMQPIMETIEQVASTRATVLIEGESGSGKERVAHAIHHLSGRPQSKLVIVHCAALSPQLLESELFGHEKGAFTGAMERRIGRFEQADGGTLVLDEIGEIDASTQIKLLRALGERTIERVGSNQPIKIDVRVLAATNKNLEQLVEEKKFREDLFYRLNVVRISMPPLRERSEDIVILANIFLKEFAQENGKPFRELSSEALHTIRHYHWPGNIRELRTVIEHGVIMSNGPKITLRHLPYFIRQPVSLNKKGIAQREPEAATDLNLDKMEQHFIRRALEETNQNRTEAAKLLGISRRTLQRKLKLLKNPS